jgi:hypothetical protein
MVHQPSDSPTFGVLNMDPILEQEYHDLARWEDEGGPVEPDKEEPDGDVI